MDDDFSIGDSSRFEMEFSIWSVASEERLETKHVYDALVIVPIGNRGKGLMLFPVLEDAIEFIEKWNQPGLTPIEIESIEHLIPLLEYSSLQGSTHAILDAVFRFQQIGGRIISIPDLIKTCHKGLEDAEG